MAKFELVVTTSKNKTWSEIFTNEKQANKMFNSIASVSNATLFEMNNNKRIAVKSVRNA